MKAIIYNKEDYCDKRDYKTIGLIELERGLFLAWHIGSSKKSRTLIFGEVNVGDVIENIELNGDSDIDYERSNVSLIHSTNCHEMIKPLLNKKLNENQACIKMLLDKLNDERFKALLDETFILVNNELTTNSQMEYFQLMHELKTHFVNVDRIDAISQIIQGRVKFDSKFKMMNYFGFTQSLR